MMDLYPPLEETGDKHRLQHEAGQTPSRKRTRFHSLAVQKYRRRANVVNGLDIALSVAGVGLAASGVGLLGHDHCGAYRR